ncbi:MAG: 1-acyl-sn-glycerol-3-phosphate acyltransferase [Gammaproteobacteria bacterium]|nr:1-acyl-sn-glycerol-3-phosphate acyltransferase [Gammaproteobacteria bacterium]|tara:strand:- start:8067 stop:8804 length:738 start_codon:yes stop_codon:yes gene_type:complete
MFLKACAGSLLIFISSLLYTTLFFFSVVFYGSFLLLPSPIVNESLKWRTVSAFVRANFYMCKNICRLEHRVVGLRNIPEKPCIVFLKHSSVYEMFFALSFFQPSSYVAKYELMFVPIIRGAIKALKCIPVKRGKGRKEVEKVIQRGSNYIAEGRWIVLCPEGTRVRHGETRKYGISGALLAKGTKMPVLPVAHNAGYYWGRRSLIKKPGTITFSVGPKIETNGLSVQEINDIAQDWIEKEIENLG